jgi:hypothetical protein
MDRNVSNPYYSIITAKDFFGGTDPIRIIIIIYIILSLILNAVIFVVIYLSLKKKRNKIIISTMDNVVSFVDEFYSHIYLLFSMGDKKRS